MTKLAIGVSKYLEGEESFAIGRIVHVDRGSVETVRVPVGSGRFLEVDVQPGSYLVQVEMPSGPALSRSVSVTEGEPSKRVEFRGPHSDHEWLSWSNFSTGAGALGSTPRRVDFSPAAEARHLASRAIELWVGSNRIKIDRPGTPIVLDSIGFDVRVESDWPNMVLKISTITGLQDMREVPRVFVVAETGDGRSFLTVPMPWFNPEPSGDPRGSVDVLLSDSLFDFDADRSSRSPTRLSVTVRDPVFAAVFGYLAGGNPAAALRVGGDLEETAWRLLYSKLTNPYAAAGAAYLLLGSGRSRRKRDEWRNWLFNLATWFPWLPDGMILAGWHLLEANGGETVEARRCFLEAAKRGVPVYTEGVRLMIQGLSVLKQRDEDLELAPALKRAREYGALIDPSTPFTVGPVELLRS